MRFSCNAFDSVHTNNGEVNLRLLLMIILKQTKGLQQNVDEHLDRLYNYRIPFPIDTSIKNAF